MSPPVLLNPGDRRGMLTLLQRAEDPDAKLWVCRCDCGTTKTVRHSHLISGATKSCGCQRRRHHSSMLGTIRNPQLVGRS